MMKRKTNKGCLLIFTSIILSCFVFMQSFAQTTAWKFQTGKHNLNPPVALDKYVFSINDNGLLQAVDASRGKSVWTFDAKSSLLQPPLLAGNTLYLACRSGDVYALDQQSGAQKWKQSFRQVFQSSPVLYEDLLIVCSRSMIMGLDKNVGIDLWKTEVQVKGTPRLMVQNGNVFFSDDMFVYAFNAKNGELLWKHELKVFGLSDIFCSETHGYFLSGSNLICLDLSNGKQKWSYKLESNERPRFFNSPVIISDKLVVSWFSEVMAFDPLKGALLWKQTTKSSYELHSPVLINGMIWVPERGKNIYQFDAAKGKRGKTIILEDEIISMPVFDKIRMFYNNADGLTICVRLN